MAFKFPSKDERANFVQGSFTEIAQRYDLFNDIITQRMHRYWKNFLVRKAELKKGDQVLDICCGTGDITERLEKELDGTGSVVGLDFSSGMLQVAKSRGDNDNSKRTFLQGDAMELPMQSKTMDVITVGYGLRNVTNLRKSIADVFRVLKPGGRFLCLDMGKVKNPLLNAFFQFYFFKIVPIIGKIFYPKQNLFDYFPQSSVDYPSQEKLSLILEEEGFRKVTFFNFMFGANSIHLAYKPEDEA
jgi:demethylmenaquinone methyltransferase/2-methoxy-6-polyprenyl-1,4-benzoquinol methylase